jgi:hypothetical protein
VLRSTFPAVGLTFLSYAVNVFRVMGRLAPTARRCQVPDGRSPAAGPGADRDRDLARYDCADRRAALRGSWKLVRWSI